MVTKSASEQAEATATSSAAANNKIKKIQSSSNGNGIADLRTEMVRIFDDCQRQNVTNRKACSQLRKLLQKTSSENLELFFDEFIRCFNRLLCVKKREPAVDRCVKFVAGFISSLQDKEDNIEEESKEFVTRSFVQHLAKGLKTKEKAVRMRSCQMLSLCIENITEIDADLFEELRSTLIERTLSKEAPIRVQAIAALSRFQDCGDEEESAQVLAALINTLRNDPSADVRKTALCNIVINPSTIPYVVERIRDIDAGIRRHVYKKIMPQIGDFRVFSISDRELILSWGLKDRDETVRQAAAEMLCKSWIPQCEDDIFGLLSHLDVVSSSVTNSVLEAYFSQCVDLNIDFNDYYWDNLTPESMVFMRSYFSYLKEKKNGSDFDVPETTMVAKRLQEIFNLMINATDDEMRVNLEFVCGEVLKLAMILDYDDEIGRRNMFLLIKTYLLEQNLDSNITDLFDVLKKTTVGDGDFVRVIVEIVNELRDQINQDNEDSDENSYGIQTTGIDDNKILIVKLKCVVFITLALERVHLNLSDNPALQELLGSVVFPAIKEENQSLQIGALQAIIQYCLLDKEFATQNSGFLFTLLKESAVELQKVIFEAFFDLILCHGFDIFNGPIETEEFCGIVATALAGEEVPIEIKASIAEGSAKILFFKNLRDEKICTALLRLYFDSESGEFEKLRQSLSFFFPLFCYSSRRNQHFVAKCYSNVIFDLVSEETPDLTVAKIVTQILDWIDDSKIIEKNNEEPIPDYADVARRVIRRCFGRDNADIKAALQFLNKITISKDVERKAGDLEKLYALLAKFKENLSDKVSLNLLEKFSKKLEFQAENDGNEPEEIVTEEQIPEQGQVPAAPENEDEELENLESGATDVEDES